MNNENHFNLSALTSPLTSFNGLRHAVLQSILNHAQSTKNDQARMGNTERGGVWFEEFDVLVGSRDWTLHREKITDETLGRLKTFYQEALQWLIDEKHVKRIDINVEQAEANIATRQVMITLNNNEKWVIEL